MPALDLTRSLAIGHAGRKVAQIGNAGRTAWTAPAPTMAERWAASAPIWYDFTSYTRTYKFDRGAGPIDLVYSIPNKGNNSAYQGLQKTGEGDDTNAPQVYRIGANITGIQTRFTNMSGSGDTMFTVGTAPSFMGMRVFRLMKNINSKARQFFSGSDFFTVLEPMLIRVGVDGISPETPPNIWNVYETAFYAPGTANGGTRGAVGSSINGQPETISPLTRVVMNNLNTQFTMLFGHYSSLISGEYHVGQIVALQNTADAQLVSDTRADLLSRRTTINGLLGL